MRSLCMCTLLLALAAPAGPVQAQAAQSSPLFPTVSFRGVTTPSRYFYLSQAVVDYEPGASAAASEQSNRFFTVMEGELAVAIGRQQDRYGPGKSFSAAPGTMVRIANESRTKARVFVSSLVPARGESAVLGRGAGGPPLRTVCSSRVPVLVTTPTIDVIQVGTRYEPGFATATHTMNEVHDILHLEGTTSYEYLDGDAERFGVCQRGQMYVGRPGAMANRTTSPAAFVFTWLATPGRPLTSPWR